MRKGWSIIPIKMAKTGAPTTGKKLPRVQEMIEMIRQARSPAQFFVRNDIKTSENKHFLL